MPKFYRISTALICLLILSVPASVQAQGLIWSLPEDGTWARYEGTYNQTEIRSGVAEGNLVLEWIRELTIKSLGTEQAMYQGEETTCHWIEFKQVTGKPSEAGIDPGSYGVRIYKVLIPEEVIIGKVIDGQDILVDYIPIVKGYRQLSLFEEVEEIETPVFQVYPLVTLLRHYRKISEEGPASLSLKAGGFETTKYLGSLTTESPTNRTRNKGEFWRSPDVPFGIAQWSINVQKENKDREDGRGEFRLASEITENMSLVATGDGAQTELETP
ncbi:hypothetical protein Pla110_04170 [Polystyrenella longa]|uniref:Uncharacterized protein n=2 Tax=Polystyrenella longa TaxID=2528007 RepID=A0A518CHL0_9PLAN|nr:hypothetical protein Pla110_04170 [Polystyrenella longa]